MAHRKAGLPAERRNGKREKRGKRVKERGCQGPATQPYNQPQSKKERKEYRVEKGKSPEAKGRWNN